MEDTKEIIKKLYGVKEAVKEWKDILEQFDRVDIVVHLIQKHISEMGLQSNRYEEQIKKLTEENDTLKDQNDLLRIRKRELQVALGNEIQENFKLRGQK